MGFEYAAQLAKRVPWPNATTFNVDQALIADKLALDFLRLEGLPLSVGTWPRFEAKQPSRLPGQPLIAVADSSAGKVCLNVDDARVYFLNRFDGAVVFMNTTVRLFSAFLYLLDQYKKELCKVDPICSNPREFDMGASDEAVQRLVSATMAMMNKLDPSAMQEESYFWPSFYAL
jgi:hypothetical protein